MTKTTRMPGTTRCSIARCSIARCSIALCSIALCSIALSVAHIGEALADSPDTCVPVPPEGNAEAFFEIVDNAVTPTQLSQMLAGIGEMGVLADGSGRTSYDLPSGVTVPATAGTQPLIYHPMDPLPMPDNPGLLDELVSGGVHSDGYNSSTSILPGPRGANPLAITTAVQDNQIRACTPLLRRIRASRRLERVLCHLELLPPDNLRYNHRRR